MGAGGCGTCGHTDLSSDPLLLTQYLTSSGSFSMTRDSPALRENSSTTCRVQLDSELESRQVSTNIVKSHAPEELCLQMNSPRVAPSSGIRFACTAIPWPVSLQLANATAEQAISKVFRIRIVRVLCGLTFELGLGSNEGLGRIRGAACLGS